MKNQQIKFMVSLKNASNLFCFFVRCQRLGFIWDNRHERNCCRHRTGWYVSSFDCLVFALMAAILLIIIQFTHIHTQKNEVRLQSSQSHNCVDWPDTAHQRRKIEELKLKSKHNEWIAHKWHIRNRHCQQKKMTMMTVVWIQSARFFRRRRRILLRCCQTAKTKRTN